jgi:hypothetical protein
MAVGFQSINTDAFCQGGKKQEAAMEDRELKS